MHEIIKTFHDYWESIKNGRDIPRFLDFNIEKVPDEALPYMSLIQVEENPRRFLYRLAGTSIATAYDEDIGGKYLDELDIGGKEELYMVDFNHVADNRATNNRCDSYYLKNGTRYSFEGWLFPFEGVQGRVSRIISVAIDSYERPGTSSRNSSGSLY